MCTYRVFGLFCGIPNNKNTKNGDCQVKIYNHIEYGCKVKINLHF